MQTSGNNVNGSSGWLRLTDYASKYSVSVSTLRRRIKLEHLVYKMEDGKYMLMDQPPSFNDSTLQTRPPEQIPFTATVSAAREQGRNIERQAPVAPQIELSVETPREEKPMDASAIAEAQAQLDQMRATFAQPTLQSTLQSTPQAAPVAPSTPVNNAIAESVQNARGFFETFAPTPISVAPVLPVVSSETNDEEIFESANRLLAELKVAYRSILQEKEEQLIHLKEEVSDLKTLVRVLEDNNQQLQRNLSRLQLAYTRGEREFAFTN